ncbi:TPA: hypothetical protein SMN72_000690 [Proteus mirabilis]|uniref:hypothetical protein n=1 Tax=Enterobacterales TaxID=91347 RepID=UPI0005A9EE85|nr:MULTISPECIES: hypothetical protein [Enterobacterales]EIA5671475.1 hypothetical protein [Escherichia coli]EKC6284933.1 hypothetical protein [Escherichia coli]ELL8906330.1 hypothetical protein [Proteus mirabilis]MBG3104374.1 hypothetical protein [Proteus mirabilis]MBQ0360538.1 hypothetical protein [Proteus mirabilis]
MKITDAHKLEKLITDMTTDFSYYTCKGSCFIGKTEDKAIVISVYNIREFEDEFNEDFHAMPDRHFCLEP